MCDRQIFLGIRPFDGQGYENHQVGAAGQPVVVGEEIRIYHIGARFRGPEHVFPETYRPYFSQTCALCLSTLRLDGYISLDTTVVAPGKLLTTRFRVAADALKANVNAPAGRLRVEIVDPVTLTPLPGYSLGESIPVEGDSLRAPLVWKNRTSLASLKDREAVRIRFVLANGRLYSFWAE